MAIIPAAIVIGFMGEGRATSLLILSQVILSFQLPFAVVPLIQLPVTAPKWANSRMGRSRRFSAGSWLPPSSSSTPRSCGSRLAGSFKLNPGNANLPIGGLRDANREIGVPGASLPDASWSMVYASILRWMV